MLIEIYRQRNRSKTAAEGKPAGTGHTRHRFRWRALADNHEKVGNGGAAYINFADLIDELALYWPDPAAATHVQVKFEGRTVPLADARSLAPAA